MRGMNELSAWEFVFFLRIVQRLLPSILTFHAETRQPS
jgi:hypothetical protein